jgi:chlorophyll/bacteriochlorophyll a synthase
MTTATHSLPITRPAIGTVAELLKPITWFPPMWAFGCGVVSSGVPFEGLWLTVIVGVILAGPMVCATSQAANDWFDRHVDAINEPNRPIPSGRMPGRWGLYIAVMWTILSLIVAATLGVWVFAAALLGLALAWAYSAPPFRFKNNGWVGNAACGLSYEGLAWITGAAVMLNHTGVAMPDSKIFALALLYSIGAHGIMTLNDFKSIQGDAKMGVRSLPVQLGARRAAIVACLMMLIPQFVVVVLLVEWQATQYAIAVSVLVIIQASLMLRFVKSPIERATWYSAIGINFFVLGMLLSAFALRGATQALAQPIGGM